jgi:hypothetical protein
VKKCGGASLTSEKSRFGFLRKGEMGQICMTDRETLIRLLIKCGVWGANKTTGEIADFLIANGVTFAKDTDVPSKWISVEDGLPKQSRYNFEEYIVTVCRSYWSTSSYDPVDAPYSEEYTTAARYDFDQKVWHLERGEVVLNALLKPEDGPLNGEIVTHWMPRPEPPKEG